jgi:SM-20-related protein
MILDLNQSITASPFLEVPWSKIKTDLELQAWAHVPKLLNHELSNELLALFREKLERDSFVAAGVGKNTQNFLRENVRLSQTCWIDNWEENKALCSLYDLKQEMMRELNEYFRLSMKRFESQFALYPEGGFYKKHLDQLRTGMHRQVSCIFYLNDCHNGGELILYDQHDRNKESATISPRKGDCVLFFSGQIFHEVLATNSPRFSLTTWFRDDALALV